MISIQIFFGIFQHFHNFLAVSPSGTGKGRTLFHEAFELTRMRTLCTSYWLQGTRSVFAPSFLHQYTHVAAKFIGIPHNNATNKNLSSRLLQHAHSFKS